MRDDAFRRQPHTRAQGRLGEDAAVEWLGRQGYRIAERNVSNRAGEIDVIAHDGDTLCFIEIKARSTRDYGEAIESVTPRKQRKIARTAALYLAFHPVESAIRFDVLGLDLGDDGWRYTLIRDAFAAPL
ncbi:MAG: YraN family protein [bacterium]|nr:YraN family protein [bacterium]